MFFRVAARTTPTEIHPRRLILVLGFLAVLGPLTVDLYLPSLPFLQEDLATSATAVQLTLAGATLGFALGQLVVGPLSDSVGRRRPLLIATAVHIIASIAIAAAPDIWWMVLLRVLQGAGAAGGGVVAMAMVRDAFADNRLVSALARIALFTGVAPVLAPFLGAQLMTVLDWRGLFVVVAAYGAAMLLAAFALIPETLEPARRLALTPHAVLGRYRRLVGDRSFVGAALIGGLMVSSVFAYLSTSAFVFQREFGLSPQDYGLVSALNAIAFVVGTQLSALIVRRFGPRRMLAVAVPMLAATGFSLLLVPADSGAVPVAVVMLVFMLGAGACGPALQVIVLLNHRDEAGTAAALAGATNFGLAGVTGPIVGAIGVETFAPLGLVMGATMTVGVVLMFAFIRLRPPVTPAR